MKAFSSSLLFVSIDTNLGVLLKSRAHKRMLRPDKVVDTEQHKCVRLVASGG